MSKRVLIGKIKIRDGRVIIVDPSQIPIAFWEHNVEAIEGMKETGNFELSFSGACAAVPAESAAVLGGLAVVCAAPPGDREHKVYVTIESDGTVSKMEIDLSQ